MAFFEKKKIQVETLGEYLSEVRRSLNLSLEEAAAKIKAPAKILEALESGRFAALPPDVYATGLLRLLAAAYDLEAEALIIQYKKERQIFLQLNQKWQAKSPRFGNFFKNLVVTPKILSFFLGGLFVLISLGYIFWQILSINKAPVLEIFQPKDKQAIFDSFVEISGRTDVGSSVSINQQGVFVDGAGGFRTQIGLSSGPKELNILAKNRFGKSTQQTLIVFGQVESLKAQGKFLLQLDFSGEVSLAFSVDEQPEQIAAFNAGESKFFQAKRKITISSSDGGATALKINGKFMGPLGKKGEKIANVSFFAESDNMNVGE